MNRQSKRNLVGIYAISNPHVWNIIDLVRSTGREPVLVANQDVPPSMGFDKWVRSDQLSDLELNLPFVPGVAKPESKMFVVDEAMALGIEFGENLVSRESSLGAFGSIGLATIVRACARLDSWSVLGDFVSVGAGAVVGHHVNVGSFSFLANGVTLGGASQIGRGVFVGLGASIRDGVVIGDGAFIGMGSVVVNDVEPGQVVFGNPAKPRSDGGDHPAPKM
jgi:acetyltransferase-like isoleucine patch superfamily enzyme